MNIYNNFKKCTYIEREIPPCLSVLQEAFHGYQSEFEVPGGGEIVTVGADTYPDPPLVI